MINVLKLLYFNIVLISTHADISELKAFDHQNLGCPENSTCSAEMGRYFTKWSNLIEKSTLKQKEAFRKNNGIPYPVWSRALAPTSKVTRHYIEWDSSCPNHQLKGQKIFDSLIKTSNLNELKRHKHIIVREGILLNRDNTLQTYPSPRGDLPLYLEGNKIVYQHSIFGSYYGLSVKSNGSFSFTETKTPKKYPRTVKCPNVLVEAFKKKKYPKNLYKDYLCQQLWNIKDKNTQIIIFGKTCI